MIKVTVTYEVYEYDELSEDAKDKAMEQFINLIIPMGNFVFDPIQKKQVYGTLKEYMWEVHKSDDNLSHILKREFKFSKDGIALPKKVCEKANVMRLKQE